MSITTSSVTDKVKHCTYRTALFFSLRFHSIKSRSTSTDGRIVSAFQTPSCSTACISDPLVHQESISSPLPRGSASHPLCNAESSFYQLAETPQICFQLSILYNAGILFNRRYMGDATLDALLESNRSKDFDVELFKNAIKHAHDYKDIVWLNEENVVLENRFHKCFSGNRSELSQGLPSTTSKML